MDKKNNKVGERTVEVKENVEIKEEKEQFKILRTIEEMVEPLALQQILKQVRDALVQAEERKSSISKAITDLTNKVKENSLNPEDEKVMAVVRKGNKYDEAKKGLDAQTKQLEDLTKQISMLKERMKLFAGQSLRAEEIIKKNNRKEK